MSSPTIIRKAVVWQLLPGSSEAYEIAHRQIPTPLADEIRAAGIRNYSIYHHPGTDQLFAYLEIDESLATSAPGEENGLENKRWWDEQMSKLFTKNPDGTAFEVKLVEVFHQE